jgi:hypothetical protein
MQPVKSTAEILSSKVLNQGIGANWVQWAIEMLSAGFDSEHLRMLAGELPPYDQLYLKDLTDKVLHELNLEYYNKEQAIRNLIDKALNGEAEILKVLEILSRLCMERGYDRSLYNFYLLYHAKQELLKSKVQFYWGEADRSNIDTVIKEYFTSYKTNYK